MRENQVCVATFGCRLRRRILVNYHDRSGRSIANDVHADWLAPVFAETCARASMDGPGPICFLTHGSAPASGLWGTSCSPSRTHPERGSSNDPFADSGSTCLAAQQLDRRYIGVELDATWYAAAQARLNKCDVSAESRSAPATLRHGRHSRISHHALEPGADPGCHCLPASSRCWLSGVEDDVLSNARAVRRYVSIVFVGWPGSIGPQAFRRDAGRNGGQAQLQPSHIWPNPAAAQSSAHAE
ncbi:hypothetical protein HDG37_002839 [Paraburkholderia sp. MM5384-R2]|nr:hypothetical protein [Paraburkholderia sp. MM5384-R2]